MTTNPERPEAVPYDEDIYWASPAELDKIGWGDFCSHLDLLRDKLNESWLYEWGRDPKMPYEYQPSTMRTKQVTETYDYGRERWPFALANLGIYTTTDEADEDDEKQEPLLILAHIVDRLDTQNELLGRIAEALEKK